MLEGLESANAYATVSLDAGAERRRRARRHARHPREPTTTRSRASSTASRCKPLLAQLAPRERQILLLRFFRNMTQSEIADEVGISQMHVSRLLARTLTQLRTGLLEND